jgi:DNA-binding phage protein
MGKIKISPRQKTSTKREKMTPNKKLPTLTNFEELIEDKPREFILNPQNIGNAIMECLMENDPEGVIEVISIYLRALNKEKFRQKAEIGKSTYYYLMKSKNPTIKTLAKIVHSMTH